MNKSFTEKDKVALLFTIAFLALALVSIWITKDLLGVAANAVFLGLLLIPVLIYLVLSGRVQELRGPGGLLAKFAFTANKPVDANMGTIAADVQMMQVVAKGGLVELEKAVRNIDETKTFTLTLTLGKQGYYQRDLLLDYVKTLSPYRSFKFVALLDEDQRFVAYLPAWIVRQILEMVALGDEFVEAVNEGRMQELTRYPGMVTKTLNTNATSTEVLQEMWDRNLEALVMTDEERRLCGVVERDQVTSKLLLALVEE